MMQAKRGSGWRRRETGLLALGGVAQSLACLGAKAQPAGPPENAPVMRAGVFVRRPFGAVEITTFSRSRTDEGARFDVEFLIRNEGQQKLSFWTAEFIRVVADGVPRAPIAVSPGLMEVPNEAAEYGKASFTVRGMPGIVHLQFGNGASGRSFLRWPD
jgi:hypothetical protein